MKSEMKTNVELCNWFSPWFWLSCTYKNNSHCLAPLDIRHSLARLQHQHQYTHINIWCHFKQACPFNGSRNGRKLSGPSILFVQLNLLLMNGAMLNGAPTLGVWDRAVLRKRATTAMASSNTKEMCKNERSKSNVCENYWNGTVWF